MVKSWALGTAELEGGAEQLPQSRILWAVRNHCGPEHLGPSLCLQKSSSL